MKRIVLDGRYINDHFPGIGRYVYNLAKALGTSGMQHQLVLLHNPELTNTRYNVSGLDEHSAVKLVATKARPFSLAEQWQIPALLWELQADLYHAPYYLRPYIVLPCPSITTLYDAIPRLFPGEVSFRARLLFDLLTRLALSASRRAVTISQSARHDLTQLYGIDQDRIAVTALAADERFHPQSPELIQQLRIKYNLPDHYILSLSSNKPHKNLATLIEAFDLVTRSGAPMLVIAGHWDARFPQAHEKTRQHSLEKKVRFLSNVANEDLPALYAGAEMFVFPSRYEGFGLPPLEALATGTPVICGDHSSLPEVVGDAALRVDVTNPVAIAHGVAELLHNEQKRGELRSLGLKQAERFSWQKTAQQTLQTYEECLVRLKRRV